jgi:hypothetical protein
MSTQVVRLRHYQGERLRGADLREEYDELTALRQLHIRAIHDAWGVALGLEVQLTGGGHVAAVVNAGLAYDRLGREILLHVAQIAPDLPADARDGIYQLVLALSDDARPLLRWRAEGDTQLGIDIPLIAAAITQGAIGGLDFKVRHYTQPLARPHIAYGVVPAEQRWKTWRKAGGERQIGFGVRVDTTSAGFVNTPIYIASVQQSGNALFVGRPNATEVPMYIFTSVANTTRTGFTFRVVIAGLAPSSQAMGGAPPSVHDIFQRFKDGNLPFRVSWIGLESIEACATAGF